MGESSRRDYRPGGQVAAGLGAEPERLNNSHGHSPKGTEECVIRAVERPLTVDAHNR